MAIESSSRRSTPISVPHIHSLQLGHLDAAGSSNPAGAQDGAYLQVLIWMEGG